MNDETQISADFPFESRYIEVHGSQLHYIDEGTGDPILFLHGNPTSAYLWRNIIPHLTDKGRCIALDLIGMGKSDKPDIGYRFFDHVRYVEGFIEKLELKNITLVIHDWGSGLGFHYAMRHEDNIKGLAFMEAIVRPLRWAGMPAAGKILFRLMRTPVVGWLMISVMNMFVNQVIPQSVVRPLTGGEMSHYRAPYPTASSRKPVRQWPREVPFDGQPADVHEAVSSYSRKLQESDLPKILFYADQGFLINPATLAWCQENFKNLKTVDIGSGRHYVQEDNPHLIGSELAAWYSDL